MCDGDRSKIRPAVSCPDGRRLWAGHLLTQLSGARWGLLPPHLKSYHTATSTPVSLL